MPVPSQQTDFGDQPVSPTPKLDFIELLGMAVFYLTL